MRQSDMVPTPASIDLHRAAIRARLERAALTPSGSESVSWTVNREIIVVAGWGRAILLQLAHPLVAAGVGDHSTFRGSLVSSFRRLASTVRAMLALSFGDEEQMITAAAGINSIHDRIKGHLPAPVGNFPSGHPYSAHDGELLRWVHATLLESIPMTYELLVGPLTNEERDRYCAEAAVMEPLLDIPVGWLPRNYAQLEEYMQDMLDSGNIVVGETSRSLARAILFPPRSYLVWPAFRAVRLITIGLLPPAIRKAYGFEWRARDARAFVRWTTMLRVMHDALPARAREWPAARRGRSMTVPPLTERQT